MIKEYVNKKIFFNKGVNFVSEAKQKRKFHINSGHNKDFLGLEQICLRRENFFSVKVKSQKCQVFSLDREVFEKIINLYSAVHDKFKELAQLKITSFIKRFYTIKQVTENLILQSENFVYKKLRQENFIRKRNEFTNNSKIEITSFDIKDVETFRQERIKKEIIQKKIEENNNQIGLLTSNFINKLNNSISFSINAIKNLKKRNSMFLTQQQLNYTKDSLASSEDRNNSADKAENNSNKKRNMNSIEKMMSYFRSISLHKLDLNSEIRYGNANLNRVSTIKNAIFTGKTYTIPKNRKTQTLNLYYDKSINDKNIQNENNINENESILIKENSKLKSFKILDKEKNQKTKTKNKPEFSSDLSITYYFINTSYIYNLYFS